MIEEFAPAKVNLSLIVRGRRADGYHDLESLVAFPAIGDRLTCEPGGEGYSLVVDGPMAVDAGAISDNLVLKAARRLAELVPRLPGGHFTLTKKLPVAAGLGGGSADAAAALRALARAIDLPLEHPALTQAATAVGADVSVCLAARSRMMGGIGHDLGPVLKLPSAGLLLVNPGVAVPTPQVFAALGLKPGEALSGPDACATLGDTAEVARLAAKLQMSRNDLEAPAKAIAPVIGEVIALVGQLPGCLLARMSGSGATVFGLFADRAEAQAAGKRLALMRPQWWNAAAGLMG